VGFEERFNELKEEGRIEFVTFHPSYSYEEFVEGYKPEKNGEGFELRDGIFKVMCKRALGSAIGLDDKEEIDNKKWKDIYEEYCSKKSEIDFKSAQPYILIIDEINRANISKVLGELIYALEYRGRPVKLLYSLEDLIVPPNLYIIGTMNTADKSIALLDVALRRRFGFQEFMPKTGDKFYELVKDVSGEEGIQLTEVDIKNGLLDLDLGALLEEINKRILFLADREKQIGHSYFMNVLKDENGKYRNKPEIWKKNLARIWYKEIIPLLQEYFYNDYGKIKMVIGDSFVEEEKPPEYIYKPDDFDPDYIPPRYKLRKEVDGDELIRRLKGIISSSQQENEE